MGDELINVILIVLASLPMIALHIFVGVITIRMSKQLAPDAHLKPRKTILIEGQILDVVIDNLTTIPESG